MTRTQLGMLNIPSMAGDPVSPVNGQVWYDTNTGTIRAYQNGAYTRVTQAVSVEYLEQAMRQFLQNSVGEDWLQELLIVAHNG